MLAAPSDFLILGPILYIKNKMYNTCNIGLKDKAKTVKLQNNVAATASDIACELAAAPIINIIPSSYFSLSYLATRKLNDVWVK